MKQLYIFLVLFLLTLSSIHAAELININTATVQELDTLPGIGPTKAEAIHQYVQDHGYFWSYCDLEKVKGIGPRTRQKLQVHITLGPDKPEPAKEHCDTDTTP